MRIAVVGTGYLGLVRGAWFADLRSGDHSVTQGFSQLQCGMSSGRDGGRGRRPAQEKGAA